MKYIGLSDAGKARVEFALSIMKAATPGWHSWFEGVIHTIAVDPTQCTLPNWLACTWTPEYGPGVVVFPADPKATPASQLAETLRHEAHHYGIGWGGIVRISHTCSDPGCQEPSERTCDPIYRSDAYFGPKYQTRYEFVLEEVRKQEEARRAAAAQNGLSFQEFLDGMGVAAAVLVGFGFVMRLALRAAG